MQLDLFRRSVPAACLLGLFNVGSADAQEPATWRVSAQSRVLGAGEDELFQAVRFGKLFSDGRAVVADARNLYVRLYAADGQRLSEMGHSGAGPGEFHAIHGMWLTPEAQIGVWDGRIRRITIFVADGTVLATYPLRTGDPSRATVEAFLGQFRDGSVLLASLRAERRAGPGEAIPERWFLGRFSSQAELITTAGELEGMWRTTHGPLPFSPVPRVAVVKDSIWTSAGFGSTLDVRDSRGRIVRSLNLPWTMNGSADTRRTLERKVREQGKPLYLEMLDESREMLDLPYVAGVLVDDRQNLWIKEYDPLIDSLWFKRVDALETSPGGTWRIFTSEGVWQATVRMPDNLVPLDVHGDNLLAVELDADDVERVVVRRITR